MKSVKSIASICRHAELENEGPCLGAVSNGASSSPESPSQPRRLDGVTHTCWCASPGTAATSRRSDRRSDEEEQSRPEPSPSTSGSQHKQECSNHSIIVRGVEDNNRRKKITPYTIEDLDAIEPAPLLQDANVSGAAVSSRKCTCGIERSGRKNRSAETRWANSFLSPEEPRWDYRGRGTRGAEFRWELHTSQTDVDIARSSRSKCSCHSLTEEEKRPSDRWDLRKHHSAEIDKWTLHPDAAAPRHHLRKHNSDDTRMARDARWTLQVPAIPSNTETRCTCSRVKRHSLSPVDAHHTDEWVYHPREELAMKKHPESKETKKNVEVRLKPAGRELKRQTRVESQSSSIKRWELKDPTLPKDEGRKSTQSQWAGKTHLSLPIETQLGPIWLRGQKSLGESVANCTKAFEKLEKQKPPTSKSLSPEPATMTSNDQHLFPDIAITDAKWAPYEGRSPLPNVSAKKRDQKPTTGTSEIKWTPLREGADNTTDGWSPFDHVTPTFFPPPQLSPNADDDGRWKFLNQISPFPIYQGAWREHTPPEEIEVRVVTPEKTVVVPSPKVNPVQAETRRCKPEEVLVQTLEARNRQRPQLLRSKALLEVPAIDPAKRSLSEEVPRFRMNETTRGPNRAKSEEGANYGDPWFANNLVAESSEMCQYVTTV